MIKVDACNDMKTARALWQRHWPSNCLFDLWPVRSCFQSHFRYDPHFLVASRGNRICGLLALSWIDEEHCFGHFPGEIWHGKTWLEQNKIVAADAEAVGALMDHIPPGTHLRYLCRDGRMDFGNRAREDETGYLFYPSHYGYDIDNYWNAFNGKSRKKIRREMESLEEGGVTFRHDRLGDLDMMFRLNVERYQSGSYFADARFLQSFQDLAAWLHANDMLRITTVLIGGKVAAVDMGAVWNDTYTVLAGGTDADFTGVAKLINLHHLKWACERRMRVVDFLCGDFNWKQRFHLTPRSLYQIWTPPALETWHATPVWSSRFAACAV